MKFWSNVALAAAFATTATAHTWIEQLMVVAANGTMVGQPGFVRGNVLRSSPSFSDPTMVNLLPGNGRAINDIRATDLMCKDTQSSQTQTSGSPRLQAVAGANVALRYQENGHVSLPQNQPGKPNNRGTVYVYGTTESLPTDEFLSIHRVWNAAGTGGDGRGVLLSTQNFDDGQCYQINSGAISTQRQKTFAHTATSLTGADLWCQQDIKIPTTAPSGKPYTLYWVWDWPTLPGTTGFPNGKQEIYTTCMDVDIVTGGGASSEAAGNAFVSGQDLNHAAIGGEFSDIANPNAVTGQTIAFSSATGVASATGTSGFSSYLTETASGSVASSAQKTQNSAAAASTTLSSQGPIIPFVSAGSNSVGETTNAAQARPSVSPIGSVGSNTGTVIATAQVPGTTGASSPNHNHGGQSTVTRMHTAFETVFHTELETVYQTQQKRTIATTEAPLALQTSIPVARCSKTEAAYRLKARIPLFMLSNAVAADC